MQKNIMVVLCDFPGQKYIRKLIVQKLFNGNTNSIPNEITNMVPFLGPLHVSLNTRETCFLKFHPFFNQLYMGHAATKPDKVNICVTKDFRDQNLVICNVII